MELRQLQYFREVCYEKSFTKAANNLFVSQPVITNSIHKLEEELEVRLLDRDTKRVTLFFFFWVLSMRFIGRLRI